MFGAVPVFAYIISKRKKPDWLTAVIAVCFVFSVIPIFNSTFYIFNAQYYSRWFYMPILLCSLAAVKALEDGVSLRRGALATVAVWGVFICGLFIANRRQPVIMSTKYLAFMIALTAFGFITFFIIHRIKNKRHFIYAAVSAVCVFAVASGVFNIRIDRKNFPDSNTFTKIYLNSGKTVSLPAGDDYRVDTTNTYFNTNIMLDKPSIDFFSSTVEGSIARFYGFLGIDRVNNSQPDYSLVALRPFLSVKYYVMLNKENMPSVTYHDRSPIASAELYKRQGAYDIYENKDFIPLGYTFNHSISMKKFVQCRNSNKPFLLLKALALTPEQVEKYSSYLPQISEDESVDFSPDAYGRDVAARQAECSRNFKRDGKGFEAEITLSKNNLVLFSVPYDLGWTAEVNGKAVKIENVDNGFMAVFCPAGDDTITFRYKPIGLTLGFGITIVSAAILAIYVLLSKHPRRNNMRTYN